MKSNKQFERINEIRAHVIDLRNGLINSFGYKKKLFKVNHEIKMMIQLNFFSTRILKLLSIAFKWILKLIQGPKTVEFIDQM